jgi:hypothetical protein
MTNELIRLLLIRLATDLPFRALVETDPITALAPYGIVVDPLDAPPNAAVTLPSSASILAELDRLTLIFDGSLLCAMPLRHNFWLQGQIPPP